MANNISKVVFLLFFFSFGQAAAKDPLEAMTEYMKYLTERDIVLAQNIANADTPGYKPKDLGSYIQDPAEGIRFATTNPNHLNVEGGPSFQLQQGEILEIKPNGNAVTIDHEMQKKSQNAIKLQEVANLYSKIKGMQKLAITGHK